MAIEPFSSRKWLSVTITVIPNNKRIFKLFKPNHVMEGESFELSIKFKNCSGEDFPGGSFKPKIYHPLNNLSKSLKPIQDIPYIQTQKEVTIRIEKVKPFGAGYHGLQFSEQKVKKENGNYFDCYYIYDSEAIYNEDNFFDLVNVVSREELYQKYSVIVALVSSIIATISTIILLIISILRMSI